MEAKKWTLKQDDYLQVNYKNMLAKTMAANLNRTLSSVKNRLHILNLKLDTETKKLRCDIGKFKAGKSPKNKGKKREEFMSKESIEKCIKSQFKKGNEPHNTKKAGLITQRADKTGRIYQYIKIENSNWQLLQRVIYEKYYGAIHKNYIVKFKDGNTMNCEIENLQLISKKENMQQNTISRFPPELISVIKLTAKLNKQIIKKQK